MKKIRKTVISLICIAEALLIIGSTAACAAKSGNNTPQSEAVPPRETQQEAVPPRETQQETVQSKETQQETVPSRETQQNTKQPVPSDDGQISLEDAKNAALADAGLSSSEVIYTEEKLDYEDGIAVYEIEFYAGNVDYEYEIDAATGEVYSKSVETHHNRSGHGHNGH